MITGIDEVAVDGEKELLNAVGDVDPVLVVKQVRKLGKVAQIVSVGPPESEDPETPENVSLPPYCNDCQQAVLDPSKPGFASQKMKKTVIQVNIKCQKCKTDVLKATTKLSGIQEVSVDGEKELLSVVGDVDPVLVVKNLRKIGKVAKIISVGPPKSEKPKQSPKKPCNLPPCCNDCQLVAVGFSHDYNGGCHIL
ncbi:hypothetical protein FEM48_Zijuj06G0197400 [Ziziphus jujuba var. spinosa]|uniref:HMA domain-containing protein n=1 Tax=Ziziphus jujuba var. spinosa TaxID=714518 RepID=A0A978VB92_ZIZJJ|nr:hypothetical protein FEM48_Zijuj06G0197400 [Ziziphus jujuba var. spinosa]